MLRKTESKARKSKSKELAEASSSAQGVCNESIQGSLKNTQGGCAKKVAVISLGGYGRNALRGLDKLQRVCSTLLIDNKKICPTLFMDSISNSQKEEMSMPDIEFDTTLCEENIQTIKGFLENKEVVVVLGGLGKSNGEIAPLLLDVLRECGVFPINVFSLPFSGEGRLGQKAQRVLRDVENKRGMHIVMPNDILKEYKKNYPQIGLRELFALQYRPICDLVDLLAKTQEKVTLQEILRIYDVLEACDVKVIETIKVVF